MKQGRVIYFAGENADDKTLSEADIAALRAADPAAAANGTARSVTTSRVSSTTR